MSSPKSTLFGKVGDILSILEYNYRLFMFIRSFRSKSMKFTSKPVMFKSCWDIYCLNQY